MRHHVIWRWDSKLQQILQGKKSIEIETLGREQYRIIVILTIAGDGTKLPPFVILKGKPGKIIENHVKNLEYFLNKKIFVCFQENRWC